MKSGSRIFLCLLLVVVMMFSLVACGNGDATGRLEDDMRDVKNDVERGVDNMVDDMTGNDNLGMSDEVGRSDNYIDNEHKTSGSAMDRL